MSAITSATAPAQDTTAAVEKAQAVVFPNESWQTATPESQGIKQANLDKAIAEMKSFCGSNGVDEVVIVRNGYVIWSGPHADRQRLVWSCTKSFLSMCLGLLWDDGKLQPSDLACKYKPEMAEKYPTVTLEHLATFTSGYGADKTALDPGDPLYQPGKAFQYSAQSDLLASILTTIGGRSLEDLFFDRIGKTIGITRAQMDWGELTEQHGIAVNGGAGYQGSGVRITASALARFGWLMCNNGDWNGKRLLSEKYIAYATVPRTDKATPPYEKDGWYKELPGNYGLNWWTNGPRPSGTPHWPSAPAHTFAAQGNKNNNCLIVPDWKLVIVRMGGDDIVAMTLYDKVFALLDPTKQ